MGADQNPKIKADADYTKRTGTPGNLNIATSTFIFVTPRKWEGKTKWRDKKKSDGKWLDVAVWDCDDLEQWLEVAPSVDAWLARMLGKVPVGVRDISSYWENLAATSDPSLTQAVFVAGRQKTVDDLYRALSGAPNEITVSAMSLQELRDFVAAIVSSPDDGSTFNTTARAVIVENRDAWDQLAANNYRLVLIPGDRLTLEKPMVAEAVSKGHHVITQSDYTYFRDGLEIRLPRADRWELEKALEAAGFKEEQSHRLAREAGGCLSILVRLASKFAGQITPV
jgi:hypothetical protein